MKAYIISDKCYKTEKYNKLYKLVYNYLKARGFQIDCKEIEKNELAFCRGCFSCWFRSPGKCIIKDAMNGINDKSMSSDVVVYISPVVFGQFSPNMKNAIDRWIVNMLPFIEIRPDGSSMHRPRYSTYPKQIIIGYGDDVYFEDIQIFKDITQKHRYNIETLYFNGNNTDIINAFNSIKLERAGGQL